MAITMAARWRGRPGAESEVREALQEFVASIRQNEPGAQAYTALQQVDDPTAFITCFSFQGEDARQFHRSHEWVKRFTDAIYRQNLAPVEFAEYRLGDSTDR